jgi:predicted nucleic acid-binding protein
VADPEPEPLLLDACVAINLLASGISLDEFAASLDVRFVVTEPASREAMYLPTDDGQGRDRIDLSALASTDTIEIVDLHPLELEHYVAFAVQVDDGEAATLAVAVHRGFRVATDDRKARRVASEQVPLVGLISTPEILRSCADGEYGERLPEAIRRVEHRASFRPRRDDANFAWWMEIRES